MGVGATYEGVGEGRGASLDWPVRCMRGGVLAYTGGPSAVSGMEFRGRGSTCP